jgi:hypothetical protein
VQISSTEIYIHVEKMLYLSKNTDCFIVEVADELEDAIKLLEIGFEYHTKNCIA